jgi:hypothetical protein
MAENLVGFEGIWPPPTQNLGDKVHRIAIIIAAK